jgi:hypothetical protein
VIITIRTGSSEAEDVFEERDVCDWLNANPGVKAVLDGVLMKHIDGVYMHPNYPTDVVHAAARVSVKTGALCKESNEVHDYDNVVSRARLHEAAEGTAAAAIRLLLEIGNLKGRERTDE